VRLLVALEMVELSACLDSGGGFVTMEVVR
jgi:hypothetical protein